MEDQQQQREENTQTIPIKKIKITLYEMIGAGIVFLIAIYMLFNWAMGVMIHSRAEAQVPDLKGTSLLSAVEKLSMLRLSMIKEGEEFNQALPEGSILRQTPIPGTMVREGKTIRVVLSKGGEQVFVPVLIDKQLRLAEIELRQSNLALGEVSERYSLKIEKGNVIEQDPSPGAVADRNTLINLIISEGEPHDDLVLMPDFVGKQISDAEVWGKDHNIAIARIIPDPHSAVAGGEVIKQIPSPDTILNDAPSIEFVVSVSTQIAKANKVWHYALPQGSEKRDVVVRLVDDLGEHILFRGTKLPGSKLEIPYYKRPHGRIQVYLDGILVEDQKP